MVTKPFDLTCTTLAALAILGLIAARLGRPHARSIAEWFRAAAGSFGQVVLHRFLTIGIASIFHAKGEMTAAWCRRFGRRLAGPRGEDVVVLQHWIAGRIKPDRLEPGG